MGGEKKKKQKDDFPALGQKRRASVSRPRLPLEAPKKEGGIGGSVCQPRSIALTRRRPWSQSGYGKGGEGKKKTLRKAPLETRHRPAWAVQGLFRSKKKRGQ